MMETEHVRQAMTEYWKENSKDRSLEEMMLDNTAQIISQEELPEILSYLPDVTGKTVLELGAGIGRFTSHLAPKAKKVIAVDFMKDFIEQNKVTNQHYGNVEFEVADVAKMERPEQSVDIIFSNWLMMYLEDRETLALFKKELSWLKPGGYLFMRESCYHKSGNKKAVSNPTQYRNPETYEAMYSSVQIPCDEENVFGFDLIFSKSVDAYIKFKQNKNQFIWLLHKVTINPIKNQGYKTFQEFLDKQQYSSKRILVYEKVFGRTFVSPGGLETTREFVSMLKLKPGQRVLDVGGGIGGSAFYMAENFDVSVVSMDLSVNMTQIGRKRAVEIGCDPCKVIFEMANATKREYQLESFNVVYSRDTVLHIEDKLALFQKFHKCLKPGGKVLITDYCCSPGDHSQHFKDYVNQRGYHLLSCEEYGKVLEKAGFQNVRTEDRSKQFADILHSEVVKTEAMKEDFIKEFDEESFQYIIDGWKEKIARVKQGDQRWGLFYAEKA